MDGRMDECMDGKMVGGEGRVDDLLIIKTVHITLVWICHLQNENSTLFSFV